MLEPPRTSRPPAHPRSRPRQVASAFGRPDAGEVPQGESQQTAKRERSMIHRPGSPTQQISDWLSRFGAALDRKDRAAAAELFAHECYWRDLISFTWNIK